jgi:hypothetical protein
MTIVQKSYRRTLLEELHDLLGLKGSELRQMARQVEEAEERQHWDSEAATAKLEAAGADVDVRFMRAVERRA